MATDAQLLSQGPARIGSHGPLTEKEVEDARKKVDELIKAHGFVEPVRSHMDDGDIQWRFGKKPDYTLANLYYFQGKYKNHKEGSLEMIVENLVKTWEMEASHKKNVNQWKTIDQSDDFVGFGANGWKTFNKQEMIEAGNYNVLMSGVDKSLWDTENTSWNESHDMFRKAMPAFAWEILEVFSGPPLVGFSWHHFGQFTGEYKGKQGNGEMSHLFGFGTAQVNDKLQFQKVEIYYDINTWLEAMEGKRPLADTKSASGCPFIEAKNKAGGLLGSLFGGCK